MGQRVLHALVLSTALLGLACTEPKDQEQTPTEPQLASAVTCGFRSVRQGVRDFFVLADEKIVLAIVDNMETACKNNQPGTQTNFGYDVQVELERVRNSNTQEPRTGKPLVAATLLSNLFKLMPAITLPPGLVIDPQTFLPATSPGGLLGVRGGVNDPNQTAVVSLGFNQTWGIEPPSGDVPLAYTSDFRTMTGGVRFFIFGSGANSFTTLTSLNTSYGLHAIGTSAVTFNPKAIIFTCFERDAKDRVQTKPSANASAGASPLLALVTPLYCDQQLQQLSSVLIEPEPQTFAGRLLRFGTRWLAPMPLFAAAVNPGGRGGTKAGLSDFELVAANAVEQRLETPADQGPLQPVTAVVEVVALGLNNTEVPVEGVDITLTIIGNQGSWNVNPNPPTGTTNEFGKATITFTIDKSGGYTVSSAASLSGYTIAPDTSEMFHILGQ